MSEVDDYKVKVKTLSYAELQEELKKWNNQQKEATGEYGYWGGVTGQEIVDEELKRRTGTPYNIEKSFVAGDGIFRSKGTTILENQLTEGMVDPLVKHGFIRSLHE